MCLFNIMLFVLIAQSLALSSMSIALAILLKLHKDFRDDLKSLQNIMEML